MIKLLAVFAVSLSLAYISDHNKKAVLTAGKRYTVWRDWAYLLLVMILVLFSGLRTSYNDTWNYISGYKAAPTLFEFLAEPKNLNPFKNPLFYLYQSLLRTLGFDAKMLIFLSALFTQVCFILFFKRYSEKFVFSIFLYFTLGTFVFTLAALKQVLAMAVLTLAFPYLEKKKWLRYYLLVAIAMLLHTYAIAFAVLPFFSVRPWRKFTFLFVFGMVALLLNFEGAITSFMEQANELGKSLAEEELFDNNKINVLRLAVYAVTPFFSFIFQKLVLRDSSKRENVLIHMSVISFAFMCMGTQNGANMFGRMANYFELGTICCLPKMLNDIFDGRSCRLVSGIAIMCFMAFFVYANAINIHFDQAYQSISLWKFLFS